MFWKRPNPGRRNPENQSGYLLIAFTVSVAPFFLAFLREGLRLSLPLPGMLAKSAAFLSLASDGLGDILMDWNIGCLAAIFFLLSLFDYPLRKNPFVPLLASVYLASGAAGILHSLALDGLGRGQITPEPLEAWAWFLGSLCLSGGLVLILCLARGNRRSWRKRVVWAAAGAGLLLLAALWGFAACLHTRRLPLLSLAFLGRPLELIPLAGFLWLGAFFTSSSAKGLPRRLRPLLGLSLLPLFASELAMALSAHAGGTFFGGALFLRMIGFLLPTLGLCVDHVLIRQERGWRAGQHQFEVVAETASDGILTVGNGNRVTYINRSAAGIFGYEPEDLVGRHVFRLVPPAHRKTVLADARGHLDGGEKRRHWNILELPGLTRSGETIVLEASINEFFNRHRPSFVVILRNITERKKFQETLQNREQYHRSLIENSSDLIGILDAGGNFRFASPSYERLLGYAPEALQGRPLAELLHPEEKIAFLRQWDGFSAGGREGAAETAKLRLRHQDGSWRLLEMSLSNRLHSPAVAGIVANAHDITAQKAVEEALRENMERYELVARGSNGGLWDWNLKSGEVYYSPRWKTILGYKEDEIGGRPEDWFDLVHPDDLAALRTALQDHLEGRSEFLESEYRMLRKTGDYQWMGVRGSAVRGPDGKAARLAGSQTDISRQKGVEEQFRYQAFHDTLTGLANRNLLFDRLQQAIRRARRSDYKFAVLFLDLDRFKGVNDSLGHLAGDQLLKESSNRLEKCLRPGDTAARLGGDEFTILLENIKDVKESVLIAERVLKELAKPCRLNDQEVFATVSIGIAMCNGNYSRPEDLLRDADTALYRAKANGRARYEIFDVDMHNRAVALLRMENDLWRAINHAEFLIHYQPILSLRTGYIVGFEALARWQHPDKGLLPPNEFIPLAEETGLIINIGEWLLKAACLQNRTWQGLGFPNLRLAVNFSARQLRHPDPLKMIQDILWETRMNAQTLELEITESIAMRTSDPGFGALSKLRLMGVPISIDDFGTGYSSLSSLKHSPASTLKIDKSFLKDIQNDPDNAAITNTIIAMAHSLQLRVIAEGVETEDQLRFLADRGCDEVQGHYFSPPLDAARATDLLLQSNPFPLKQKLPSRLPQN